MPVAAALAVTTIGSYSAYQQAGAARSASRAQARGVQSAQDIQREFTGRAVDQLGTNFDSARNAISIGENESDRLLQQSGGILSGGFRRARRDIEGGFEGADSLLQGGYGDAINTLDPTYQQGLNSSQLQADLSGAMGADAQQRAYSDFTASPGQEYLRNQQEQAILRNATALGGGLGAQPAVMQQLQENAFGLAQSDFNNSYGRLSEISGRGDNAARSISALQEALGTNRSGLQQQLTQILSGMTTGEAGARAGINADRANLITNTRQARSNLYANQGTATSNAYMGAGSEQAQLAQNLGQANSAFDIYQSQNQSPAMQGIISGIGAYTAASREEYTGTEFEEWRRRQLLNQ